MYFERMFQVMRLIADANLGQPGKGRQGVPIQRYFPKRCGERFGLRQGESTQANPMGRSEQYDSRVVVPVWRKARIGAGGDRSGVHVSGMGGDQRFRTLRVRRPGRRKQSGNLGSQTCRCTGVKCAGNSGWTDQIRGGGCHGRLSWTSRKRCSDYRPAAVRRRCVPSRGAEKCRENLLTLRLARVYY